jgi:hypothetical protein
MGQIRSGQWRKKYQNILPLVGVKEVTQIFGNNYNKSKPDSGGN